MPWNITLLLSLISVQTFVCILMIIVLVLIHPITSAVHSTLDDISLIIPEMNDTLTDVKKLVPQMKHMIGIIQKICISVNCNQV